jgi:glycosyltransferase involved in cell wall biosynthesis
MLGLMNDWTRDARPLVDIAIPVHNEERDLERSVRTLHAHLDSITAFSARITIVDNASTDNTGVIGVQLTHTLDDVRYMHLDAKGRGRALRAAWMASDAQVVAYMDVDLSTRIDALIPLIMPILSGQADIAVGSRLMHGARVTRSRRREVLSRGYNLLLRAALHVRFRDAQCGFKAIRTQVARELVPLVRDDGWFFDTELLVLGERAGLRIREIPVEWIEDPDSRVNIPATVLTDVRGVVRMLRGPSPLEPWTQQPAVQPRESW